MTVQEHRLRSIRVADEEVTKVLDELDRVPDGASGTGSRRRYRYRIPALRAQLGSPPVLHHVPTRWISVTGIAFLHGCLVYDNTYCLVQPVTLRGNWHDAEGVVNCCGYLQPNLYEVEVLFTREVDPTLYCTEATPSRVLVVEDDPLTARMIAARLKGLNAKVEQAENGQVAVEQASQSEYDLILMDIEMPVMDGFEAVAQLRARGYMGQVVAMSSLAELGTGAKCLEAGFDQFLAKPFEHDDLSRLLTETREEPLYSSLQGDPAVHDLIHEFVQDLPQQSGEIQQAISDDDAQRLRSVIRQMKARGASYGFEMISEAAARIEAALLEGAAPGDVREDTNRLLKLCALARAPGKSS